MPSPIPVRLTPHDPRWAEQASVEAARVVEAPRPALVRVHHIGSTAIPGIAAKPVLDLLGVAASAAALDALKAGMQKLGYVAHGEFGLVGRRYFTLTDEDTGKRRIQLHCYAEGDPAIARHLAFRDHLRARSELAAAYEREKIRCARIHPEDSHAYTDCKGAWIRRVEAEALAFAAPPPGRELTAPSS